MKRHSFLPLPRSLIERPIRSQWVKILFLSLLTGLLGGLSAVILKNAIKYMIHFFFQIILPFLSIPIGTLNLGYFFLPIIGALIISPILSKWNKASQGGGVGNILESVAFKRCNLKGKDWFFKLFGSAITIGSGGSGGPEGPIIQMNASLSGFIGHLFHLSPNEKRILVACGVSSGIAAFFNAPLGGTIFSIELLIPSLEFFVVVPVFFAGILGGTIGKLLINSELSFIDHSITLSYTPSEFVLFLVFGILMGFLAFLWLKLFTLIQKRFNNLKVNTIIKPVIGAIPIGILLTLFPNIGLHGDGISYIDLDQLITTSWWVLVLIGFGKMITTAITIGSGGSAGVFAPSLFIGTMFGGAFASIMNILLPGSIENEYIFFIIGMGAFFAAASQEPLGILLIITEMIANAFIVLPLMVATMSAFLIQWWLTNGKLIYTINQELNQKPIRTDTMTHLLNTSIDEYIKEDVTIIDFSNEIPKSYEIPISYLTPSSNNRNNEEVLIIPVILNHEILGFLQRDDINKISGNTLTFESIQPHIKKNFIKVNPHTKLLDALDMMEEQQTDWVFVVHSIHQNQFYGLVLKKDIIRGSSPKD